MPRQDYSAGASEGGGTAPETDVAAVVRADLERVFDSMQALGKNGVLVLSSVTGGDQMIQVPADRINLEFVLGNKVMVGTVNANREYFEMGVKDLAHAEAQYPGWLARLLTHPVKGLENWQQLLDTLTTAKGAIKVYCEVAEDV